jgi:hypothetical protein
MRNVSHRPFTENQNAHFMFNNFPENRAMHEVMWKNLVEPDSQDDNIV